MFSIENENENENENEKLLNVNNSIIIISRFNEDINFIEKIQDFKILVYEKENKLNKYNIPINKGNEASVYLKYIIDNYYELNDYTIFLHCHEFSWHHSGSIIDIINNNIGKNHYLTNLNNYALGNMEDLDKSESSIGLFFREFISPATGPNFLYPNFTKNILGCAQFIVNKKRIQFHSKKFYENIYYWLINTEISNFWSGRFLEWTWDLFWDKCIENIPIKVYLNEYILDITLLNSNNNIDSNKKNDIINSLNKNNYCYIDHEIILILNSINDTKKTYKFNNKYIYNKFI